jgi:hypothetical protein
MNNCPAVKASGDVCGKACRGNPRCAIHMKTLETNGPHTTAQKELSYVHRAAYKRLVDAREPAIVAETNLVLRDRLTQDLNLDVTALKLEQRREMAALVREHEDEVRQTGVDPDLRARQRREELNRQREEIARLRWQQRVADAGEQVQVRQINAVNRIRAANAIVDQVQNILGGHVAHRGELGQFAHDNQNVHTQVAVQQTKDMVEKILSIPVLPDYRWNLVECSKTPGDIVMCCKLTPKSGWQMMAKYCQDESIYELGPGIYGKVLDGVWQFILKSSDKEDLCRILKQEMEDNIGMCAQGNLTRLCNILAGYMDGIGAQESPAEILGRKLPLLMEVEDGVTRLQMAFELFVELAIPEDQWLSWAAPLVEDGTLILMTSGSGQVIGLTIA